MRHTQLAADASFTKYGRTTVRVTTLTVPLCPSDFYGYPSPRDDDPDLPFVRASGRFGQGPGRSQINPDSYVMNYEFPALQARAPVRQYPQGPRTPQGSRIVLPPGRVPSRTAIRTMLRKSGGHPSGPRRTSPKSRPKAKSALHAVQFPCYFDENKSD
jgi:hypothetical protein